jgi:6-phosphogluconolactonase
MKLLLMAIVTASVVAAPLAQAGNRSANVALYAGIGDRATLARQSSLKLPGFVQEAWASPATPFLYVAWSNGGSSYNGSGVAAVGDRHGVTAFHVDPSGALRVAGTPASLRSRPIHITGDIPGRHLLVAYNDPSSLSVHTINADGSVGAEVPQAGGLDTGIYGHQIRVMPSNKGVILVTRGNQPTASTREDPGAVKVFRYDEGKLTNRASIAPGKGIGFRSRHLDFHPTRPWVFLTLESQNKLEMFTRLNDDSLSEQPVFSTSTLAGDGTVSTSQTASTVHVHPNGQFVYVGNRGGGTVDFNGTPASAGGRNEIVVFRINQETGEPSLIQNIETRGFTPRTFALDPGGRLLVVGNQTTMAVRDGATVKMVPANVSVFTIRTDGTLDFVKTYDVAVGRKPLWWIGLVALH